MKCVYHTCGNNEASLFTIPAGIMNTSVFTVPVGLVKCVYHTCGTSEVCLPYLWGQWSAFTVPVGIVKCVYRASLRNYEVFLKQILLELIKKFNFKTKKFKMKKSNVQGSYQKLSTPVNYTPNLHSTLCICIVHNMSNVLLNVPSMTKYNIILFKIIVWLHVFVWCAYRATWINVKWVSVSSSGMYLLNAHTRCTLHNMYNRTTCKMYCWMILAWLNEMLYTRVSGYTI